MGIQRYSRRLKRDFSKIRTELVELAVEQDEKLMEAYLE